MTVVAASVAMATYARQAKNRDLQARTAQRGAVRIKLLSCGVAFIPQVDGMQELKHLFAAARDLLEHAFWQALAHCMSDINFAV